MNNTAPIGLGILAVAGVFGLIGGVASYVAWHESFIGGVAVAGIIAVLVAIILRLGWGSANAAPGDVDKAASVNRAGQAPTVPASGNSPTPAPSPAAAAPTPAPAVAAPTPKPAEAPKAKAAEPAPAPAPKAEPAPKPAAAEAAGQKPATLTAAREGGPDDLKQIKGVGPKMEEMLHAMGFYHFDQVANWTGDEVAWVDQNLEGFKGRVTRDDWVPQAKTLAEGGQTEFSSKVKKGGVY